MKRRRVVWAVIAVLVACLLLALLFWRENFSKRVLPDGTVLTLSGVKVGRTNVYLHGNRVSKALGPLAPSNGVNVAGIELKRPAVRSVWAPEDTEILSVELKVAAGSTQANTFLSPPFHRHRRLLLSGDDDSGFVFVKEMQNFRQEPDGVFTLITAESYPRDSRQLHFRLEERTSFTNRDWRETATFVVRNPKPARVEPWVAERFPRHRLAEGLEVEVGELTVSPERIHPTDIWEHTAVLPVRVHAQGQLATNWNIQGGTIRDASGNHDSFTFGFSKRITNDWTTYRIFRPLDPRKVWKFQVDFARDADFPATNLYSFSVPWPLGAPVQTNMGGHPVRIEFVQSDMLSVELIEKPAPQRLNLLRAVDDRGTNVLQHGGSWGQHVVWRKLSIAQAGSDFPRHVHATIAIDANYRVEFLLQPNYRNGTN